MNFPIVAWWTSAQPTSQVFRGRMSYLAVWIYLAASLLFVVPSCFAWFRRGFNVTVHETDYFLGQFPSAIHMGKAIHCVGLLTLGWLYWLAFKSIKPCLRETDGSRLFQLSGLITVVYLLGVPWLSPDVFVYIGTGWLEAKYGLNPYYHAIAEVPSFQSIEMFSNVVLDFVNMPRSYGPFFQKLMVLITYLSDGNVQISLLLVKVIWAASHLVNGLLVWKICRACGKPPMAPFFLFTFNPLILFNVVTCAHNDGLMMSFVLLACLLAARKKWTMCHLALAAAVNVKYIALLLFPFFLIYSFKQDPVPTKVKKLLVAVSVFSGAILAGHLIYLNDTAFVTRILTGQLTLYRQSFFVLIMFLLSLAHSFSAAAMGYARRAGELAFVIVYGVVLLRSLMGKFHLDFRQLIRTSFWVLTGYLLIASTVVAEWYLTWIIPLAFILCEHAYQRFGIGLTIWFAPWSILTMKSSLWLVVASNLALYFIFLLLVLRLMRADSDVSRSQPPDENSLIRSAG
jgi:alpha-1,6-mannosyltransferase